MARNQGGPKQIVILSPGPQLITYVKNVGSVRANRTKNMFIP